MGIIGHVVKPKGLRYYNEIKTYGELCEEITKTEEAIEDVKNGLFYEFGDEFDLQLHLNHLKKIKVKNEKKFRMQQELGVYECPECKSSKLEVSETWDVNTWNYIYEAKCLECGHEWVNKINKFHYREIHDKVENEFLEVF